MSGSLNGAWIALGAAGGFAVLGATMMRAIFPYGLKVGDLVTHGGTVYSDSGYIVHQVGQDTLYLKTNDEYKIWLVYDKAEQIYPIDYEGAPEEARELGLVLKAGRLHKVS